MRKRLFSILLAQCMVLCLVPTTAFAEDSMEETNVCGNVTIYGGKASNTACLFALDMILLVCILKHLKRGDIFAKRQQRNKEENTDRMRPSLFGARV